jgi:hypothetical protein
MDAGEFDLRGLRVNMVMVPSLRIRTSSRDEKSVEKIICSILLPALAGSNPYHMRHWQFLIRKGDIFRYGKEIDRLRGGVQNLFIICSFQRAARRRAGWVCSWQLAAYRQKRADRERA